MVRDLGGRKGESAPPAVGDQVELQTERVATEPASEPRLPESEAVATPPAPEPSTSGTVR